VRSSPLIYLLSIHFKSYWFALDSARRACLKRLLLEGVIRVWMRL
jgi:hypothetical protein